MLTALGVSVALVAAGPYVGQPPPGGCVVEDLLGRCLVSAVDPGRPGRAAPELPAESTNRGSPRQEDGDDGADAPRPPPPPNYLVRPFAQGGWVRGGPALPDGAELLATLPQASEAPAVDPGVLAQEAIEALEIAPPELRLSVDGTGYVGVPVWLWLEGGEAATGPVSATATAGGAQVTATARLSMVEWSMGPPGELVRCTGPGTPWTGQDGPSPDCGYVYTRRSLPERTAGRGVWTVTATAIWSVTWSGVSAGALVEGTDMVALAGEVALPVGELQVLVGGGDR